MILSTNPPFLFIHIPKTAGTSIEEALFEYQDFNFLNEPHPIVAQYKTYLPSELYNSLFKFSFVRNPWSLQVSTYKYYVVNNGINMTFDEYIKWKFTGNPMDMKSRVTDYSNEDELKSRLMVPFHVNRMPQVYFLIDESGEIQMDFIGSLENINNDINTIVDKLKLEDIFLPHSNRSHDSKPYTEYYSNESKEIVTKRFEMDIKIFGYKYGDNSAPKNTGFITKKKFSDYGLIIPQNFYFNLGMLPYGYHDIIKRYDEVEVNRIKDEFSRNKIYRRIESLNNNLYSIEVSIREKEDILFGNPTEVDSLVLQEDILKLREYELVYKTQLRTLEIKLNGNNH